MKKRPNLKQLRNDVGLTIEEICKEIDASSSTIRNWEQGRHEPTMSAEKMIKILKLYGCSLEEFNEAVKASIEYANRKKESLKTLNNF